jgi:nitroreductase
VISELSLYEAIRRRSSVRKYEKRALEKEKLDQVLNFAHEGLVDGYVTFIPVNGDKMRQCLEGSFGKFFNAPKYFIMAARENPHFLLETGYRGERAILAATSLGLGTCWIGGLITEDKLRASFAIDATLRVIAVSPIGYASAGVVDGALGGLVRRAAGSHQRKPMGEIVFAEKYGDPLDSFSGDYSRWENVFQAVRVAPSWANYQPWRFVVCDNSVYAVLAPPRDKQGMKGAQIRDGMDYTLLDLGIAIAHFDIARNVEGIPGNWELFGDDKPEIKARLRIPGDHRLAAVWK